MNLQWIFVVIFLLFLGFLTWQWRGIKRTFLKMDASKAEKELEASVDFYQQLAEPEKQEFLSRVLEFLASVRVTGVGVTVEDKDRVLLAAAAIIPIFRFKKWKYHNIHTVLLYPDRFTMEYQQQGSGRNVLGMVGNGPMQNMMVISRQDLRQGFAEGHPGNTAIHEFVHLLDKSDGAVDGIPASLMQRQYVLPWLQKIHKEIARIKEGDSDINPYGATNEAEFLAVASEYFFEEPEKMQEAHPRLYAMLEKIFSPR